MTQETAPYKRFPVVPVSLHIFFFLSPFLYIMERKASLLFLVPFFILFAGVLFRVMKLSFEKKLKMGSLLFIHLAFFLLSFLFLARFIVDFSEDHSKSLYQMRFFSPFFIFLIVFLLYEEIMTEKVILSVFKYVIFIFSVANIVEVILVNIFKVPVEFFVPTDPEYIKWAYITGESGYQRPFGLIGNLSAVPSLIVIMLFASLMFQKSADNAVENRMPWWFYPVAMLGILSSMSGQAFITLFVCTFIYLFGLRPKHIVMLLAVVLLMAAAVYSGKVYKLSLDNFQVWLDFSFMTWDEFYSTTVAKGHFLFGNVTDSWDIIDIFMLFMIANVGILFTAMYWLTLFYIFAVIGKGRESFVTFLAIFISSQHYPAIFYIQGHVIVALICAGIIHKRFSSHKKPHLPSGESAVAFVR